MSTARVDEPADAAPRRLPFDVTIDADGIGGASAALMIAPTVLSLRDFDAQLHAPDDPALQP